jgi:hypothetical protein
MTFKFKKERLIYAGYSVFSLSEGTIVKVTKSPNNFDTDGILVRTGNNVQPFRQLVETKGSVKKGCYWGGGISTYEFEVLKDKKESDYD